MCTRSEMGTLNQLAKGKIIKGMLGIDNIINKLAKCSRIT